MGKYMAHVNVSNNISFFNEGFFFIIKIFTYLCADSFANF